MPVYEYHCGDCAAGFTALRPMARSAEPADCPDCGGVAERRLSVPLLATLRPEQRRAHQTNERSANAPRVTQPHRCGAGCSHQHGSTQPALKSAAGNKRPWMIGH